jgi:hypothetical protein
MPLCSRCGRTVPPGVVCPSCGTAVPMAPATYWVASPPGEHSGPPLAPRRPYTGPPRYTVPPRWGFPLLGWRWPAPLSTTGVSVGDRMRMLAATAIPLLWLTAVLMFATAGAELWRYALLLASRTDAVPGGPLRASDALVVTGGVVSVLASVLAASVTLSWLLRAAATAAETAGVSQPRPAWQLLAGVLIPGVNLLVPGSVLAELEHAALGLDPNRRPRPSRLVAVWWALWAAGLLFAGLTLLWSLRQGVQAQADAVLLHMITDLLAGAVAIGTVVVVRRLTALLSPPKLGRRSRMLPVRVAGGPATAG